jgi:hypothetical protein
MKGKILVGKIKKQKERLLAITDELDLKAKLTPLSAAEQDALRRENKCVTKFRRNEETKWTQRASVKHVQEGENNRKYFIRLQMVNIGRRKNSNLSRKKEP